MLDQLMQMLGGQSTPPALGGPQPPAGTPYPLGQLGGNERMNSALQGIGAMKALEEARKYQKTASTVGMQLDKPTRVNPMQPGIGPADLQARAQAMGGQQSPQGMPPGGMPGPGGGPPGMPGGGGGGLGALLGMLASRGGLR